jgi:hypothetical protein
MSLSTSLLGDDELLTLAASSGHDRRPSEADTVAAGRLAWAWRTSWVEIRTLVTADPTGSGQRPLDGPGEVSVCSAPDTARVPGR